MVSLYDIVRLKKSIPEKNLKSGTKGTVLIIHDEQNLPLAYVVEFINDDGTSLAVVTVEATDVEKV